MENITMTKDEYRKQIMDAYKRGFAAAISALQFSYEAIEDNVERAQAEPKKNDNP